MKLGYFTIFGIFLWLLSLGLINEYFVHSFNLRLIAALIALFFGIIWLTKKENRSHFRSLKKGIIYYTIAFVVVFINIGQIINANVSSSESFKRLESEIRSDLKLSQKIGEIKLIGIGKSINYKSKNERRELKISVIVFGEQSSTNLNAEVVNEGLNKWKVDYHQQ
jgi:hypothetical protein